MDTGKQINCRPAQKNTTYYLYGSVFCSYPWRTLVKKKICWIFLIADIGHGHLFPFWCFICCGRGYRYGTECSGAGSSVTLCSFSPQTIDQTSPCCCSCLPGPFGTLVLIHSCCLPTVTFLTSIHPTLTCCYQLSCGEWVVETLHPNLEPIR